jgi:hypothetical protein
VLGRPWPGAGEPLFTPEDTAWALALHEQEQAEAAERCPLCGLPTSICRAAENQFRFEATQERCHATWRLAQAQSAQGGDDVSKQATAWSAQLRKT